MIRESETIECKKTTAELKEGIDEYLRIKNKANAEKNLTFAISPCFQSAEQIQANDGNNVDRCKKMNKAKAEDKILSLSLHSSRTADESYAHDENNVDKGKPEKKVIFPVSSCCQSADEVQAHEGTNADKKELEFILQEGEGLKIEFKENIGNIGKEMAAFVNTSGGRIFMGVDDDGIVKGIKITNELMSQVQDIANNCDPSIEIELKKFENILIIEVKEGKDKPYKCKEGFFIRIGPNSQKMNRDKILELAVNEGKVKFDEQINKEFEFEKDFDEAKLNNFLKIGNLSKALSDEEILSNLNAAKKEQEKMVFNNAGVLFFSKDPQKFIPWSVFTVALFKDKGGADVIDRKEIIGGLFEIVDKVMDFVRLYGKVAYKFTGKPKRENIYEYPFEAIREAVINSVMHKNYLEHGHNNILKFFPDRIQIENIWIKPKNFKLGETVYRRNRLIADLFSRIHFGERLGSGMERMKEYCNSEEAPYPEITFTDTHFYVVFRPSRAYLKMIEPKKVTERVTEKVTERVTENQAEILERMSVNKFITAVELAKLVGMSERKIKENISKLKEKGLLKRIGPDKGGYWKILRADKSNN